MKSFAVAIHGGAGVISSSIAEDRRREYLESLRAVLSCARELLEAGGSALDVVTEAVRLLEDDSKFNAGLGAVFNVEGGHELEAAIMEGASGKSGAVAGLRMVKNPIVLARMVMERSAHCFMMGEGAEGLAEEFGLERVENRYFDTPHRLEQLRLFLAKRNADCGVIDRGVIEDAGGGGGGGGEGGGTVGCVALDWDGHLAAATSTGGMTGKRVGRIGDSPIIGAGTFAKDGVCAVSATGRGEAFIQHGVAHEVAALVRYSGLSIEEAAHKVVHQQLEVGDGGLIAVGYSGEIALPFNSTGMFRGAADSDGLFEVRIWAE